MSHRRVLEMNRMRVFDTQKKLENLQSEFMHKIRLMGSELRNQGVFKFVGLTVNDECKLVVHHDDLLRLPKSIRKFVLVLRLRLNELLSLHYPSFAYNCILSFSSRRKYE